VEYLSVPFIREGDGRRLVTSEQECTEALRGAARRLGESPTKAAYENLGLQPSAATILRVCGGWNDAKERAGLSTNPSTGTRVEPKPEAVDLPEDTEWTDLSQDQRWHYRNREWNAERTLERRQRLRDWLRERKRANGGCVRCGRTDPACLDYHHREGEPKRMAVNEMVLYGYGRDTIREEIGRCVVLCANCHAREHGADSDWLDVADDLVEQRDDDTVTAADLPSADESELTKAERLRAWTAAYECSRGCRRCGESDPVCLQFHHVDGERRASVGELIANSCPEREVLDEVRKCVVLCANCHRLEHRHEDDAARSDRN